MSREQRRREAARAQREEYAAQRRREAFYAQGVKYGYTRLPDGANTTAVGQVPSGGDVTDPNSYVPAPMSPSNPNWPIWAQQQQPVTNPATAQPLPTGRAFGEAATSDETVRRMRNAKEFLADPVKFAEENGQELNQEQSLMDQGMSFLGRIFNYEDKADLQILGMPLAPVESVWDGFMRRLVGGYDLLNIGFGGLISAMPGGVRTLSYDELSAGRSVSDVLSGEIGLLDNAAPSPMQIAIASVAVEAKRIREGDARLSDVLLANPATAPFILAGIAAESSPLQQPGFDIMDPEARKAAFSQGWEQWMSGIGDFGLSFADPLIAAGAGAKVARMGLLGTRKGKWTAAAIDTSLTQATNNVLEANGIAGIGEREARAMARQAPEFMESPASATRFWDENFVDEPIDAATYSDIKERAFAGQDVTPDEMALMQQVDTQFEVWKSQAPPVPVLPHEPYMARFPKDPLQADEFWQDQNIFGLTPDVDAVSSRQALIEGRTYRGLPDEELSPEQLSKRRQADRIDKTYAAWRTEQVRTAMDADGVGSVLPGKVTKSADELGLTDPLERLINDAVQVDENGRKVMSLREMMKRREFRRLPGKGAAARILHDIDDPYTFGLVLKSMHGVTSATDELTRLAPALSDEVFAWWQDVVQVRRMDNPVAWQASKDMLGQARHNLVEQKAALTKALITEQARGVTQPLSASADIFENAKIKSIDASIRQIDALDDILEGKRLDPLEPGPFYNHDYAMSVIEDLYRRQDVVERALRSEVRAAFRSVDADSRIIMADNWYARTVAASRERRARAAYQYEVEGAGIVPKRKLATMTTAREGEKLTTAVPTFEKTGGWFAPSQFEGVGRVRRAARVWRWFGTETPNGYIGFKGASKIGSENELIATLDLDLYKGEPVTVTYWDEAAGKAVTRQVGGEQARDEMVNLYMLHLSDPRKDPMTAITMIEERIAKEMSLAYGYSEDAFREQLRRGNKSREELIEQIKNTGFFIDPDSSERHYVPYLKTHLANGTYMHNWQDIERLLQRHAIDNYGTQAAAKARSVIRFGVDVGKQADEAFQNIWRPAVLFRLSYTQRNVFEGMLRAMAYTASLAPLSWPVRAAGHAIESKVRSGAVNRAARRAAARAGSSTAYREVAAVLDDAAYEYSRLSTALRATIDEDEWSAMLKANDKLAAMSPPMDERYFVFDRGPDGLTVTDVLSPAEWDARMTMQGTRLIEARSGLEAAKESFDRSVKGTKFGRWRDKNIKDLQKSIDEIVAQSKIVDDLWDDHRAYLTVDDVLMAREGMARRRALYEHQLYQLMYSPMDAAKLYADKAGRARRMYSGTSIGADGGRYNDAFADEYEAINRGLASSDMTRKQSLSAASDAFTNIFQRVIMRHNEAIPWGPGSRDQWLAGMADVMNRNSFNPLVRVLLDNDFDTRRAIEWMTDTAEGRKYAQQQSFITGTDFRSSYTYAEPYKGKTIIESRGYESIKTKTPSGAEKTVTVRTKPFQETFRNPVTGMLDDVVDMEQLTTHVTDIALKLRQQMQDIPGFTQLQRQRSQNVARGLAGEVTPEDVARVVDNLTPEERLRLGAVQGSMLIEQGTPGFWNMWRGLVDKAFTVLGTIPEDAVVRGPFYGKRFRQIRDDLIENYWAQRGMSAKDVRNGRRKAMKSKGGQELDGTISHPEFTIEAEALSDIYATAHAQALQDTRDWMYTIERRTKLGKYGEYLFPFISAQQNSMTVAGRLLWRNPWLAPLVADLWRAPSRLGWEDEEGNLRMPMPSAAVRHWLNENDVPILGGLLQDFEYITIPKDGLNVFMPDTGFGVLPRPSAWIQVSASELMKQGAFPVETPGIFDVVFGEENGDDAYQLIKDYIFGEQGTMSSKPLSWDLLAPATVKRIVEGRDELSAQYGYQYQTIWATENARYFAGERDTVPTSEEVAKKTTDMFWFMALGNFGVPTPLTPYPILTRPEIQKVAAQFLNEQYLAYQQADALSGNPGNSGLNFYNAFGTDLLPLAMTKVSKNVGGAEATPEAVTSIQRLEPLLRDVTPLLGEDLNMLDMLVNNRDITVTYDESAYQWQKATRIAGTAETWRRQQSPEEAEADRYRQAGWIEYQKFMDGLDARLFSMGLTNYQQAAAAPLRQAKDRFVLNMSQRDDRKAWYADFADAGGSRTKKAVMLLEKAVGSPEFRDLMMQSGKQGLLGAMDEYVYYRRSVVQAVAESGYGFSDDANMDLRMSWSNIRQNLANRDVRFAEIMNRWLAGDENPQYPGDWLPDPLVAASMEGEYVG